jgi:dihydroxyacetone kinase-like protein
MRKIINKAEHFVDEMMDGIIAAYGDRLKLLNGDRRILLSAGPQKEGKVGIVTGGGSGHLPLFLGYVGQGMLDGCAVGLLRRKKRRHA